MPRSRRRCVTTLAGAVVWRTPRAQAASAAGTASARAPSASASGKRRRPRTRPACCAWWRAASRWTQPPTTPPCRCARRAQNSAAAAHASAAQAPCLRDAGRGLARSAAYTAVGPASLRRRLLTAGRGALLAGTVPPPHSPHCPRSCSHPLCRRWCSRRWTPQSSSTSTPGWTRSAPSTAWRRCCSGLPRAGPPCRGPTSTRRWTRSAPPRWRSRCGSRRACVRGTRATGRHAAHGAALAAHASRWGECAAAPGARRSGLTAGAGRRPGRGGRARGGGGAVCGADAGQRVRRARGQVRETRRRPARTRAFLCVEQAERPGHSNLERLHTRVQAHGRGADAALARAAAQDAAPGGLRRCRRRRPQAAAGAAAARGGEASAQRHAGGVAAARARAGTRARARAGRRGQRGTCRALRPPRWWRRRRGRASQQVSSCHQAFPLPAAKHVDDELDLIMRCHPLRVVGGAGGARATTSLRRRYAWRCWPPRPSSRRGGTPPLPAPPPSTPAPTAAAAAQEEGEEEQQGGGGGGGGGACCSR